MNRHFAGLIVLAVVASIGLARGGAGETDKFAWGENIGWTNWADAGDGLEAALLNADHLEGFVWGENVGFINLGNGAGPYTNADGLDFGVNIDPGTGIADGFAWGENIGWINFDTTPTLGADGARYDFVDDRFYGYAWGENIGWINLNDNVHFVSLGAGGGGCPGDCDNNGVVNFSDLVAMLGEFGGPGVNPGCDADNSGTVNFSDLVATLGVFGPCP